MRSLTCSPLAWMGRRGGGSASPPPSSPRVALGPHLEPAHEGHQGRVHPRERDGIEDDDGNVPAVGARQVVQNSYHLPAAAATTMPAPDAALRIVRRLALHRLEHAEDEVEEGEANHAEGLRQDTRALLLRPAASPHQQQCAVPPHLSPRQRRVDDAVAEAEDEVEDARASTLHDLQGTRGGEVHAPNLQLLRRSSPHPHLQQDGGHDVARQRADVARRGDAGLAAFRHGGRAGYDHRVRSAARGGPSLPRSWSCMSRRRRPTRAGQAQSQRAQRGAGAGRTGAAGTTRKGTGQRGC